MVFHLPSTTTEYFVLYRYVPHTYASYGVVKPSPIPCGLVFTYYTQSEAPEGENQRKEQEPEEKKNFVALGIQMKLVV